MTAPTRFEIDEAVAAAPNFKTWLAMQGTDEHMDLLTILEKAPAHYDFKSYVKLVPEERLDNYLAAEAAWKTDVASHHARKHSLGLDVLSPEAALLKSVSCGFKFRSGRTCSREVVPGVDRCPRHGGALVDPEVRRSILLSAYATIVEGSTKAVAALLDVAENGRSEMARVQAAKELLDRAGLTADVNVNIKVTAEIDAGQILRERLNTMLDKVAEERDVIEVEAIEDAEIIEDAAKAEEIQSPADSTV